VEAGWDVDPYQFGDTNPHLFIFGTADGYETGCYDDKPWTGTCMPWIGIPGAKFALGQAIASSTPGGAQSELTVYVLNGAPGAWPGWVITVGVGTMASVLGYYPITDFHGGPMSHAAATFQVGGEVYDGVAVNSGTWTDPPHIPMGMGGLGGYLYGYHQGSTWTAAQHDYRYFTGSAWISSNLTPLSTRLGSYAWNQSFPKGATSWQNYFYFGNLIPTFILHL
jgi:hypothetical protein